MTEYKSIKLSEVAREPYIGGDVEVTGVVLPIYGSDDRNLCQRALNSNFPACSALIRDGDDVVLLGGSFDKNTRAYSELLQKSYETEKPITVRGSASWSATGWRHIQIYGLKLGEEKIGDF